MITMHGKLELRGTREAALLLLLVALALRAAAQSLPATAQSAPAAAQSIPAAGPSAEGPDLDRYYRFPLSIGAEYESLTGRNYGPGPGAAPPLGSGVKRATYDSGGWLMPGYTLAHNATGQPERVTSPGGSGPAASGGPSSVHIYLDGQEIHGAVKQQNYIYNGNNGNRARGGGPSGAWTPRG